MHSLLAWVESILGANPPQFLATGRQQGNGGDLEIIKVLERLDYLRRVLLTMHSKQPKQQWELKHTAAVGGIACTGSCEEQVPERRKTHQPT